MLSYSQSRAHAELCGFVLGAEIDAVPIHRVISRSKSGRGAWLAVDVFHPETLDVIYPAGFWIEENDIKTLESIGVDYVILEN